MSDALMTAVHMMSSDMQRMNAISHNMVNATTPGYKREVPVFRSFDHVMQTAIVSGDQGVAARVGLPGVSNVVDGAAGSMRFTGKPFDLAVVGDGYFEVRMKHGTGYTRAGGFHLDASGRLVNEAGFAVQGMNGDIILNGANASIDGTGSISQNGQPVAKIKIVRFPGMDALVKAGDGIFEPRNGETTVAESNAELRVGHLENSNVVPMREMVMMMETARHFEAAQKLFQGYDEQLGAAIQSLGGF